MSRIQPFGVGCFEKALPKFISYSPVGDILSCKITLRKRKQRLIVAVLDYKIAEAARPARENNGVVQYHTLGLQEKPHTISILSPAQVIQKMQENTKRRKAKPSSKAMYSSVIGGITIDPTLMVIPLNDRMVYLGHGVFDTALIIEGHIYELDVHLDRFLRSAGMAKISPPSDRTSLRNILIQTVAASQCKQGSLRYWLTAGPGDFFLSSSSSSTCNSSAFYAVVIEDSLSLSLSSHRQGVRVVTSTVPMKPPRFATMKNVNYLPNVLSKMEAEERGAYAAIWFDDEGFVAEGPNMNVAFITKDRQLLMPSFEKILGGCTAKRILNLAPALVEQGVITDIQVGKISAEECKAAEEMMLIGSGVQVTPVVMWDEQPVGNGKCGRITLALLKLLLEDMKAGPGSIRIPVPY